MVNSIFDSIFSSESCLRFYIFLCLEKVPFIAFYSGKIGVWCGSQMMWDSFQTIFNAKKLSLPSLWNPSYAHVLAWLKCAYAYACMRAHT